MAGFLSQNINKNFIVFEGIDGSGKGAQIELLKEYFKKKNKKNVVFTFEHTREGFWSDKIEEIISGKIKNVAPEQLQLLFILDRKEHIEKVIAPALKKGNIVFSDRYFLSTLAYGSLKGGPHWKTLWNHHKEIIGDEMIMPAKIIFFDVSPDIALSRIELRNKDKTIFEKLDNLRMIRENFLSIGPHFDGFEVIDANGTVEEVFEILKEKLKDYL
jgi:dTMP kinase